MASSSCTYCGDAPVSHLAHRIDSTLSVLFGILVPSWLVNSPFFDTYRSPLVRVFSHSIVPLLIFIHVLKTNDKPSAGTSARTKVIWTEAQTRNLQMQELTLFGRHIDECRVLIPGKSGAARWEYFQSIPVRRASLPTNATWVDDKQRFKKRFIAANLPIARGKDVLTEYGARRTFKKLNAPVIVKPRDGSRARHTSVNVQTEQDLVQAFHRAQQLCQFVMIEEYIPGDTHRATCVGGRVVGVIRFEKAAVIADGKQTCDQLRTSYNKELVFHGAAPVQDNEWYRDALAHQGYTTDVIPPPGTRIVLAEHSERSNGGSNRDITEDVPASTIACIEAGAQVTGLPVIGFDIISKDLTREDEQMTFIEGNSLPFIQIHHDPTVGKPRNVAGAVWDLWETM